jgi:multidrug efflux pump subunit AcrB
MPKNAFPDEDSGTSQITVELAPGVRIEDTARVTKRAAEIVASHAEVADVLEMVGGGDDNDVRNGQLFVALKPHDQRKLGQKAWQDQVQTELNQIPDARVSFSNQQGWTGRDVTFYLTGDDPEVLEQAGRAVLSGMRGMKELRGARINGDMPKPEIQIKPRLDLAAQLGVTVQSISQTVRIATLGDIPQNGAKFSLSDRQVPIRVGLKESAREDLSTIENLPVPTMSGGSVPLKAVAEVKFGQGPVAVRRYNQSRRLMIDADLTPGSTSGDAEKKIAALPAMKNLPSGVRKVDTGNLEFMAELMQNFALAMGAGILMVFAVLVLLFARVFQPITILSALPLSLGGALLALSLCGMPFSLPVVIGTLMLMGIVAKNSILLVDFAIEELKTGKSRMDALIEAGHKRAQPIVMTSVAMIAGMLPSALGLGEGSEFRAPMAVAVIGGIVSSTFLTLVVVPAMYTLVDDFERWIGPKFGRHLTPHETA